MSIDNFFEYKIPEKIKNKIPRYFYYALGGECVSIFGKDIFVRDEDGIWLLDYYGSTQGYVEALKATCKKLNMNWLFEYWKNLPWYQSDIFDGEIIDEIKKTFSKNESSNPYYKYLLELGD